MTIVLSRTQLERDWGMTAWSHRAAGSVGTGKPVSRKEGRRSGGGESSGTAQVPRARREEEEAELMETPQS